MAQGHRRQYDQRRKPALASKLDRRPADDSVVVPVVALQQGAPRTHIERLWAVQDAMLAEGVGEPDLKVYEVSLSAGWVRSRGIERGAVRGAKWCRRCPVAPVLSTALLEKPQVHSGE
jgi:hypothetical protein